MKVFKLISITVLVTLAPFVAKAVDVGVAIDGKTNFDHFMDYMGAVFFFAMRLGAALTTLMIVYAGYKYMTSQGNPTAIGEAKEIIIGSLSGFAMLLLIYLILNVLGLPAPS